MRLINFYQPASSSTITERVQVPGMGHSAQFAGYVLVPDPSHPAALQSHIAVEHTFTSRFPTSQPNTVTAMVKPPPLNT